MWIPTGGCVVLTQESAGRARSEGRTWDEIGQSLGVSRQAAWERFATTEHEQLRKIMLERFGGWPRR
jgi:hypothetical protein